MRAIVALGRIAHESTVKAFGIRVPRLPWALSPCTRPALSPPHHLISTLYEQLPLALRNHTKIPRLTGPKCMRDCLPKVPDGWWALSLSLRSLPGLVRASYVLEMTIARLSEGRF